jgi:hypothetical protein
MQNDEKLSIIIVTCMLRGTFCHASWFSDIVSAEQYPESKHELYHCGNGDSYGRNYDCIHVRHVAGSVLLPSM